MENNTDSKSAEKAENENNFNAFSKDVQDKITPEIKKEIEKDYSDMIDKKLSERDIQSQEDRIKNDNINILGEDVVNSILKNNKDQGFEHTEKIFNDLREKITSNEKKPNHIASRELDLDDTSGGIIAKDLQELVEKERELKFKYGEKNYIRHMPFKRVEKHNDEGGGEFKSMFHVKSNIDRIKAAKELHKKMPEREENTSQFYKSHNDVLELLQNDLDDVYEYQRQI